jgi:hypothetical protein
MVKGFWGLDIRECDRSQPGVPRKVTNITIRKYRLCQNSSARAGRRSSVGCDGTRRLAEKIGPEAIPKLAAVEDAIRRESDGGSK